MPTDDEPQSAGANETPSRGNFAPENRNAAQQAESVRWRDLGDGLLAAENWVEAIAAYRSCLDINFEDALAWCSLGTAYWALGNTDEAEAAFEESLFITRENPAALVRFALFLANIGEPARSLALLKEVLDRQPTNVEAWLTVAAVQQHFGERDQAVAAYHRALELAPHDTNIHHLLAKYLIQRGELPEAEAVLRRQLQRDPLSADLWAALSSVRQKQAELPEAIAAMRQALAIRATPGYHSSLLQLLQYENEVTAAKLLAAHRQWDEVHAAGVAIMPPPPVRIRAGERRVRIGFVASNLARHPVGFFSLRVLELLDKNEGSIVCYHDSLAEDDYTARYRAISQHFRTICRWSDQRVAEQIRADAIDVLIDVLGHSGNRLLVFARRPAPVQISWAAYVGTTGLRTMDYLLADRFHVRSGEEANYTERILRMPHDYICFEAPAESPEVAPLPAAAAGYVTFGCFNNALKLSPGILEAWASILERVPQSRLLLKNRSLGVPELRERLWAHFARHSIAPERIVLEGEAAHRELLGAYGRVDIALDTQPYSGGLTTCEALWMGVPVITFPGPTFAGRHSTSHLQNAGFPEFVAENRDGYIESAVQWAQRLGELSILRAGMRERARQSALCDAPRFGQDLMALLHQTLVRAP